MLSMSVAPLFYVSIYAFSTQGKDTSIVIPSSAFPAFLYRNFSG